MTTRIAVAFFSTLATAGVARAQDNGPRLIGSGDDGAPALNM